MGIDHSEDGNIKMDLHEMTWWGMDWIVLAEDIDMWRTHVNAVLNVGNHKMWGISWLTEDLFAFPRLVSIKLAGYLLRFVTHLESKCEYDVYMTNVKQFMEKAVNVVMDGSLTRTPFTTLR
jgi:hypothetical protein